MSSSGEPSLLYHRLTGQVEHLSATAEALSSDFSSKMRDLSDRVVTTIEAFQVRGSRFPLGEQYL